MKTIILAIIIKLMVGVDFIGATLNVPTIEAIDGLNQLYYDIENL